MLEGGRDAMRAASEEVQGLSNFMKGLPAFQVLSGIESSRKISDVLSKTGLEREAWARLAEGQERVRAAFPTLQSRLGALSAATPESVSGDPVLYIALAHQMNDDVYKVFDGVKYFDRLPTVAGIFEEEELKQVEVSFQDRERVAQMTWGEVLVVLGGIDRENEKVKSEPGFYRALCEAFGYEVM